MSAAARASWVALVPVAVLLLLLPESANPQFPPGADTTSAGSAHRIDLPTTLRLAGAQNLDIRIARERLAEARASRAIAIERFFPWGSPGIVYREHDDLIQGTAGDIVDVEKSSYAPGITLAVQVEIGDAFYKSIESHRLVRAAEHALGAQHDESLVAAVGAYFDLAKMQAAVETAKEAVKISSEYEEQIRHAVDAGIAFKGDALRVEVQTHRNRVALERTTEQRRVAAARLAQILHFDPAVELAAEDSDLVPMSLIDIDTPVDSLVRRALVDRDEIGQNRAQLAAAASAKNGAIYGPILPAIGAQAFLGRLGGGPEGEPDVDGASKDYMATISWRIGPGGLFDLGRIRAARARERTARLAGEKTRDVIVREVVESAARVRSLSDQITAAEKGLAAAEETLRLSRQRREFGVGIVLEYIQAEQDLTRARNDYFDALAELNKAQYSLLRSVGGLGPTRS